MYKSIEVFGVPLYLGASRRGTDAGPSALRIAGLNESLEKIGRKIVCESDISVPPRADILQKDKHARYKTEILTVCRDLAKKTYNALNAGHTPLIIGGDHSIAMGSVSGVSQHYREQNKNIGLLWFDAHADINIPLSSASGNIHGMPLAHLLGFGDEDFINIVTGGAKLKPENVALIGVRDIDSSEHELIKLSGINVYSMHDIDERGMGQVSREAIEVVSKHTEGFHVSFDVDGCDPEVMPGSGTLVPGGVSFREAHLLLEKCADTGMMTSMDVVELNPFLDNKNISAERAVSLIQSAFGCRII